MYEIRTRGCHLVQYFCQGAQHVEGIPVLCRPRLGSAAINQSLEFSGCLLLFVFVLYFFHVIHATVAEFDKFDVFVEDLVVLVGFREVLLDER